MTSHMLTDLSALGTEPEFAAIVERMVAGDAPALFAVVQEYGERVDARVAAWGMAFPDHAEVIGVGRTGWMSLQAPEGAVRMFETGEHIRVRLVWLGPRPDGLAG